jgi:hypothetical protein
MGAGMKDTKPSLAFQAIPDGLYHTSATVLKLVDRPAADSHAGYTFGKTGLPNLRQ